MKNNQLWQNQEKKASSKRPRSASATVSKAVKIYDEQKKDYQDMMKTKVRQGKKVTTAAKEASASYKKMYGSTPTARWHHALRMARL